MRALKQYAKHVARSITDPIERKEARNEFYSHLLESYEEIRKTSSSDEEAIELAIEYFGNTHEMASDLKKAHIKRLSNSSFVVILSSTLFLLILLYVLLLMVFN